ncbi:MAG TPA: hypothetical protein VKS25_14545 [Solirubrobacteraceae bacterium]|nr:hypothetical protein [Solirubrobacteraceae bacterium]
MPVPRRFDRRPPERDPTRINERIRVPEVRLIGEDGEQIGVLRIDDALRYAQERDLDLVEVALLRVAQRVVDLEHADLLAVLADQAYLWNPNPLVDPGRIALWRAPVEPTRDRHYR